MTVADAQLLVAILLVPGIPSMPPARMIRGFARTFPQFAGLAHGMFYAATGRQVWEE
ncbi:MAG: hypothetical protein ACRD0K_10050 [Egibacteraceae bacterium]